MRVDKQVPIHLAPDFPHSIRCTHRARCCHLSKYTRRYKDRQIHTHTQITQHTHTHTYSSNPRKEASPWKEGCRSFLSHFSLLSTGRGAPMRRRKDPWVLCTESERSGPDYRVTETQSPFLS